MSFVGVIKNINYISGTGFVDCAETYELYQRDVFIHKLIIGAPHYNAIRKGEVVLFKCQLDKSRGDKRGMPQVTCLTNDRLELAALEGRLEELEWEDFQPEWPPDLTKGFTLPEEEKQAQLIASMAPQIMVLPDGQLCYVVPQAKANINIPVAEEYNPNLNAYRKKNGYSLPDLGESRKRDANVATMFDTKVTKYRKDFIPNPGLDYEFPSFRGIVSTAPDEETGFGFISSCDSVGQFNRDVFLHRKECPWVHFMDLEKGDPVIFQVKHNADRPYVTRVLKVDIENPQTRWFDQ
jgi:cold shock CspA family protein